MKKLKLDLADIQVLSFTMETAKGGGTVNAHITEPGITTDVPIDVAYGTTTLNVSHCNTCPYCFDANTNPDYCGDSLACG